MPQDGLRSPLAGFGVFGYRHSRSPLRGHSARTPVWLVGLDHADDLEIAVWLFSKRRCQLLTSQGNWDPRWSMKIKELARTWGPTSGAAGAPSAKKQTAVKPAMSPVQIPHESPAKQVTAV